MLTIFRTAVLTIIVFWIVFLTADSLKNDKDYEKVNTLSWVKYLLLFIVYLIFYFYIIDNKGSLQYSNLLTFTITTIISNFIYSVWRIKNKNLKSIDKEGGSVVDLAKLIFVTLLDIFKNKIKLSNQDINLVKKLVNQHRIIIYSFAFIVNIIVSASTDNYLNKAFTSFIIFDTLFSLFLEVHFFNNIKIINTEE
ncbi:hypothetical protein [Mammaliicoccus sp. A-M2]|uniref:hypothetical protein n=1 Tax=Mammaliicoccus sp. A-M2 TaxID=2898662 RepID=UPI001EFA71AC|nr:hypothetical protein [Mammaliicoccus sp. A-M2]